MDTERMKTNMARSGCFAVVSVVADAVHLCCCWCCCCYFVKLIDTYRAILGPLWPLFVVNASAILMPPFLHVENILQSWK